MFTELAARAIMEGQAAAEIKPDGSIKMVDLYSKIEAHDEEVCASESQAYLDALPTLPIDLNLFDIAYILGLLNKRKDDDIAMNLHYRLEYAAKRLACPGFEDGGNHFTG